MSDGRENNGRFTLGNRANPNGRPRKGRSVNETILKELRAPVTITENQRRRKVSKLAANAKQIANQGASGELRAAKMAIDLALKAESEQGASPPAATLSQTDQEIVARFIARLRLSITEEVSDADAQL